MNRVIATVMTGDGRMQLALEVLPGEKLQFTGGQAFIVDHRDQRLNTAVVMAVLRTPNLIVMPTSREDDGWEDWFQGWMAEVRGGVKPLLAEVIMPNHDVVPPQNPPRPGDVTFGRFRPADEPMVIGLVTSQEEVERRRVEESEPAAEAEQVLVVEPATAISWAEALAAAAPVEHKKGEHKPACQCNSCKKARREAEALSPVGA